MKITILWSELASYTHGIFSALARQGVEIQLFYFEPKPSQAPYEGFALEDFARHHAVTPTLALEDLCQAFAQDICLMVSWNHYRYRVLCKALRARGVVIAAATDNQWRGTIKQWLGVLAAPWYLRSTIDFMIVPGDRQANFMRRLGYRKVLSGWYAADAKLFEARTNIQERRKAFLFVGRFIGVKGFDVLLEAYQQYRKISASPWELHLAGAGPLQGLAEGMLGVTRIGFIQPAGLAKVLNHYRCLVLPSLFEPWGVVVHEAALCGLAIVTTPACGAGTAFVRHGYNGFVTETTVSDLCSCLLRLEALSENQWASFSLRSSALGRHWTMDHLKDLLLEEFQYAILSKRP